MFRKVNKSILKSFLTDVKVSADSAILVRDTDTDNEENMATKIPPNVKSSEKFKGQGNVSL